MPVAPDERCQGGAVGAGALNAERDDLAKRCRPAQKLPESTRICRDRQGSQDAADRIQDRGDVDVFMGIYADDNLP
jgi:hypothetical protein